MGSDCVFLNISKSKTVTEVVYKNDNYVSESSGVFTIKTAATYKFDSEATNEYSQGTIGSSVYNWLHTPTTINQSLSKNQTFTFKKSSTQYTNDIMTVVWVEK